MPVDSSTYQKYYNALQQAYGKDGAVEKGAFNLGFDDFKQKLANQDYAQKIYGALDQAYGKQGAVEKGAFTLPFQDFYGKISKAAGSPGSQAPSQPTAQPATQPSQQPQQPLPTAPDISDIFRQQPKESTNISGLNLPVVPPSVTAIDQHSKEIDRAANNITQTFNLNKDKAISNLLSGDLRQQQDKLNSAFQNGIIDEKAFKEGQKQLFNRRVNPGADIANFKQDMAGDPGKVRQVVDAIAKTNPDQAKQLKADMYLMDSKNRPEKSTVILHNAKAITDGHGLDYDIKQGVLKGQEGFFESLGQGFSERNRMMNDYGFYTSEAPDKVINKLEGQRGSYDPDLPVNMPYGIGGHLGQAIGQQGIATAKASAAGSLTSLIPGVGEAAAPWVAAAVTSPEFYKTGYVASLENEYHRLRNQGTDPNEALSKAKEKAQFDAKVDVAQGAIGTAVGARIGLKPGEFTPTFENTIKNIAIHSGKWLTETGMEGGGNAMLAMGLQELKNIHAGRPAEEGALDTGMGQLMFTYGLGALTKAGRSLLNPKAYQSVRQTMARAPENEINTGLASMVRDGSISNEEAADVHSQLTTQREADNKIPPEVTNDNDRAKIQGMISERDALDTKMEGVDKAYHPELKEQIKALNEKIAEASKNPSEPPKAPSTEPTFQSPEDQQKLKDNEIISQLKPPTNGEETQGNAETEKVSPPEGAATQAGAAPSFLQSRHADTIHDEEGIVSGPNNKELSTKGKRDANDLAKDVEGKGVTTVITSGLERSKETGHTVADKVGAKVESRPELNTWDIKHFDGLKDDDFKDVQKWFVEHPDEITYRGPIQKYAGKQVGESINEYANRIIPAMERVEKEGGPETLLINHSNNMMLWDAYLKNGREWNDQTRQDYLNAEKPEPATLTNKSEENNAIKDVVNSGGEVSGKKGFYSEEEIEESNKKLDAEHDEISNRIQDKYRRKGLTEKETFEKALPEIITATKDNSIQRNAMQSHNEALFKKMVGSAIDREKGLSNETKDMLKDYFRTDGKDNFSKTTTKEVKALLKDENGVKVLTKMIAREAAAEKGLDFDGVMGSGSGWTSDQKKNFLGDAAKKANSIIKNILESVQKGYENDLSQKIKDNALPIESGTEVHEREQIPDAGPGSERGRVEPSQQGNETPGDSAGQPAPEEKTESAGEKATAPPANDDEWPFVEPSKTGVAERIKKEREFDAGVKAPQPGEGMSKQDMVDLGRKLLKDGRDPEEAMRNFENDPEKSISTNAMALSVAHLEQLAKATDRAVEDHGENSKEAEAARAAESAWTQRVQPMQTEWAKIGTGQQAATEVDTGTVTSIKRAFREVSGKPLTEKQTDQAKEYHDTLKQHEARIADLESQLDKAHHPEEPIKTTTFTEKTKKAADAFRKTLKTKEFTFKDSNGNDVPIQKMGMSWNDIVEVGAKAIEKTGEIADGIAAILDKVKDADWYKNLSKDDQDRFGKELEDHYANIADKKTAARIKSLEKQLADLEAGKVKQKGAPRKETDREKELKDQIFEAKKNLGLIKSKATPTPKTPAPKTPIQKPRINIAKDFIGKKDNNFTPEESSAIWDHEKEVIKGGKDNFHDVIQQVGMDTGMSNEQVRRAIAQPKGAKVVTDKMYAEMYRRNQVLQSAKIWVKSADLSASKKFWSKVIKVPSAIVTALHGSVAPITHVGTDLYRPSNWKSYFNFMIDSYKFSFGGLTTAGKARYEKAMGDLVRDPMYMMALKAGLRIDPTDLHSDDYSNYQSVFGRLSKMGERGFNAMKPYRLEQFKKLYNGLADQAKGNADVVKAVAHIVNLQSGTTEAKIPPGTDLVMFAPKLVVSQYQRIFTEPAKAIGTLVKGMSGKPVTDAEKLQATMVAKHSAQMVTTYLVGLAANQAILGLTGSKQKINFTNPLAPDWMKYKILGKDVDASGGMNSALRFVGSLVEEGLRANGVMKTAEKGKPGDTEGRKILQQGTNKLSPAAGDVVEGFSGTDGGGNSLPWSSVKPSAGKEKLTWPEYFESKSPIFLAEGFKTFNESAKENGMSNATLNNYLEGVVIGVLSGTTGAHIQPDASPKPKKGNDDRGGGGAGAGGNFDR